MKTEIFTDWFESVFVEYVSEKLDELKIPDNVILLIDNCAAHANAQSVITENFSVKFLPPIVKSVLHSMDQGVIETFERIYKNGLLR